MIGSVLLGSKRFLVFIQGFMPMPSNCSSKVGESYSKIAKNDQEVGPIIQSESTAKSGSFLIRLTFRETHPLQDSPIFLKSVFIRSYPCLSVT